MSLYKRSEWKVFSEGVIQLDGFKCRQCKRGQNEVVLQVHHLEYIPGLKPWEYATSYCITLCKGCHAKTHGIIQPTFGWEYMGEEDLGDLVGNCENNGCGSKIRHSFTVFHKLWGTLEVGTICCDNLTDSEIASNTKESRLKFEGRRYRFINSKRWRTDGFVHKIKQGLFDVEIIETDNHFSLNVNGKKGKPNHATLALAKMKLFEIIENGELIKFFTERNFDFAKQKRIKKSSNSRNVKQSPL